MEFGQKRCFKFKTSLCWIFLFANMQLSSSQDITDGLESCELLVDYCDLFIFYQLCGLSF